jgi:hypothetical protein
MEKCFQNSSHVLAGRNPRFGAVLGKVQALWSGQLAAAMGWACSGHLGWLAVVACSTTAESQTNRFVLPSFQTVFFKMYLWKQMSEINNIIPSLNAQKKIPNLFKSNAFEHHQCRTPKLEIHLIVMVFTCHMWQDTPRCSQVAKLPHAPLAKGLGMQPPCMGTLGHHQLKVPQLQQRWTVPQLAPALVLAPGLVQEEPNGPSDRSSDPSAGATKGPRYHNIRDPVHNIQGSIPIKPNWNFVSTNQDQMKMVYM